MGYPYDSYLEAGLSYVVPYLPVQHGRVVPPERDQTFLLGSRFADYGLALVFAVLFPVARKLLTYLLFKPLGEALMLQQLKKSDVAQSTARLSKWCESCWKMTIYITFSALAFLVSYKEVWFTDPAFFWLGCTKFPPCNLHVSNGVLLFYCVQTGFYTQAIHYLLFIEVKRKDFLESMTHHVVTLGLLVYSYSVNFTRVGIMIMLIHDFSDIFLEIAKMGRYLKRQRMADGSFLIFFITWVLLRVLYFPLVIIRSTLIDPIELIAKPYDIDPHWHHIAFNAMLMLLFVLHLYWSWLILIIVIGALKGPGVADIREDNEQDD